MILNQFVNDMSRCEYQLRHKRQCSSAPKTRWPLLFSSNPPDPCRSSPTPTQLASARSRMSRYSGVDLSATQNHSDLISKRLKHLAQLRRYHSGPCLEDLASYCSPPSTSSALHAGTTSTKISHPPSSRHSSMTSSRGTFPECFGVTLQHHDDRDKQVAHARHEMVQLECDGDTDGRVARSQGQNTRQTYYSGPLINVVFDRTERRSQISSENQEDQEYSGQEENFQQAQDTRRHDYSGTRHYVQCDLSPGPSTAECASIQDTYGDPEAVRRTPAGRTMEHQRNNDLEAVKRHIFRSIRESGSFATWTYNQRLAFIRDQREKKLRQRESGKEGTYRLYFPNCLAEGKDLEWLKKIFAVELQGLNQSSYFKHGTERSIYEPGEPCADQDDEEVIIKTEVHDEDEHAVCNERTNHGRQREFDHAAAINAIGMPKELNPTEGDNIRNSFRGSYRTPAKFDRETAHVGTTDMFADASETEQIRFPKIVSSGSTIPSAVGPEWRQCLHTNRDGYSTLITPRTWKWDDSCQPIEWPPLDHILPPFEPQPNLQFKRQRKRKRVDSTVVGCGDREANG